MESIWRKQIRLSVARQEEEKTGRQGSHREIIVVGGGMAGLLIAYYLKESGKEVLVLEAKTIASGQTEGTTAKLTSQHGLKYSKLIQTVGMEEARRYARANEVAIKEFERLIRDKHIQCDFERLPSYLYSRQEEELLRREAKAACALGIDAFFTEETRLPFPVTGAVCFRNQAQFSPLAFIQHISKELEIREHSKVTAIRGNCVYMGERVMTADAIIIATHYPIRNVPGFYFLRQHQERSYCLALSGCEKLDAMYYGMDRDGLSLRQAGEYLLLGGGSHRTGENCCGGAYDFLEAAAKQLYPHSREEARWSAQDCMPHDGIPFIGRYSFFTPNLYVATGFQKWGMTSSMIAAMLLRDELNGIENPYSRLFQPQRIHIRAAFPNLLHDMGVSVKGLTKGLLGRKEKQCTHMGCALTWNPDEESWDCPCHGSRFAADGELLDNPAKKNKEE